MTSSSCKYLPDTTSDLELIKKFAREKNVREDVDDAFFVGNLDDIVKKLNLWRDLLPMVKPFYAVKCNSEQAVLKLLADHGVGFDCASKMEVQMIQDLGVAPSRIVYANPCKQKSHLRFVRDLDLYFMTFDNEDELRKVKDICPQQRLVLRILTDDSTAQCQLGLKYGCHPSTAPRLLEQAKELGLVVIGVSFHVGSGCRDAGAYAKAISSARDVMDAGNSVGFEMSVLDIGGGFPGQKTVALKFTEVAMVIKDSLDEHFPASSKVQVIAEPGRFFVASAFTLAVNVIAKRVVARDCQTFIVPHSKDLIANSEAPTRSDEPGFMYYVNDGVYGSFNCLLYDHATVFPKLLKERSPDETKFSSSLWGPSCDGLDRIIENMQLPILDIGEWIYFKDMGAYTLSVGSEFNGFKKPHCFYVNGISRKSLDQTITSPLTQLNGLPYPVTGRQRIKEKTKQRRDIGSTKVAPYLMESETACT